MWGEVTAGSVNFPVWQYSVVISLRTKVEHGLCSYCIMLAKLYLCKIAAPIHDWNLQSAHSAAEGPDADPWPACGGGRREIHPLSPRTVSLQLQPSPVYDPFLLLVNLLIIFTSNCFNSTMLKCLQIAPFDQTLHLLTQMTKKNIFEAGTSSVEKKWQTINWSCKIDGN